MSRFPEKDGIHAAGGVIYREKDSKVVLVHRPRYSDWSLPKGKVDDGESYEETAVREIKEETGIEGSLGEHILDVTYEVGDKTKTVVYYAFHADNVPDFEENVEVDELRWVTVEEAKELSSYQGDSDVLDAFLNKNIKK